METGTWLGVGALLVSAAGALNSMRKQRGEERSATHGELQALNAAYRSEIDRLRQENREAEDECRRQIAGCNERLKAQQEQVEEMRATIVRQANQLAQLEKRREPRNEASRG